MIRTMPAENTAHQLDVIFGIYMQRSGVEYNYIYNANLYSATCSTGRQRFTSKSYSRSLFGARNMYKKKKAQHTLWKLVCAIFLCVTPITLVDC